MFVVYDNTTRIIAAAAPGTRSIAQFPHLNNSSYSYLSTTDDAAVLANPSGYFVDAGSELQLRHTLAVSVSPASINADGLAEAAVTVVWNDGLGNRGNAAARCIDSGVATDINSFYFYDANSGWAVGNSGTILTTTDGGLTWTPRVSGTTEDLYGVAFGVISGVRGFVVGNNGTILKSMDSGVTWAPCVSGVTNDLYDCVAVEDTTRWRCVGDTGTILYSGNQGVTWILEVSGTTEDLFALADTYFGKPIACGTAGTIIQRTGGGWGGLTSGTTEDLYDITMGNDWSVDQHMVIVTCGSNGTILRTNDEGVTWESLTSGTTEILQGIAMQGTDRMVAAGYTSSIKRSDDGGNTWMSQTPCDVTTFLCVRHVPLAAGVRFVLGGSSGDVEISDAKEAVLSIGSTHGTLSTNAITTVNGAITVYFTTDYVGSNIITAYAPQVYDPETTVTSSLSYVNPDSDTVTGLAYIPTTDPLFTYGQEGMPLAYTTGYGLTGTVYGKYIYVDSADAWFKILEFDTSTNTFTATTCDSSSGAMFEALAVDPTGTYIYGKSGVLIDKFTRATGAYVSSVAFAANIGAIVFNPSGTKYYATDTSNGYIRVYDYATDALIKSIGDGSQFVYSVQAVGNYLYGVEMGTGAMVKIDTVTDTIVETSAALAGPPSLGLGIAYDGIDTIVVASRTAAPAVRSVGYYPYSVSSNTWGDYVHIYDIVDGAPDSIVYRDGYYYVGSYVAIYAFVVDAKTHELLYKFPSQNTSTGANPYVLFNVSTSDYIYSYTYAVPPQSIEWFRAEPTQGAMFDSITSLSGMVSSRDIEVSDSTFGYIFVSANGQRWRMTMDNFGAPVVTPIP